MSEAAGPDPDDDLRRLMAWVEVRLDAIEALQLTIFEKLGDYGGRLSALERQGSGK